MNPNQQEFDQLRRLLALKRYERPHPGYFNDFSCQVVARIKTGERAEDGSVLSRLTWNAPWLERLWAALEAKPIFAGAIGAAACGLLLAAVVFSDVDSSELNVGAQMNSSLNHFAQNPPAPTGLKTVSAGMGLPNSSISGDLTPQSQGSLFEEFQRANRQATLVNFVRP